MILFSNYGSVPLIIFSQNNATNHRVYSMEIRRLYSQLCIFLGSDTEGLGEIIESEFKEEEWIGRKWKLNKMTIRLIKLKGYFQLYLEQ